MQHQHQVPSQKAFVASVTPASQKPTADQHTIAVGTNSEMICLLNMGHLELCDKNILCNQSSFHKWDSKIYST